jgi:hypothetical protein
LEKLLAAIEQWSSQKADATEPITISIDETCRMTGYGRTTVWKLIKERKIKALRRKDVRRTLPYLASVKELLAPPPTNRMSAEPRPKRGRGRPNELPQPEAPE